MNADEFQIKRANNKILKVKLKAEFYLCMFISAMPIYLEIPGLDLLRNILLTLLFFVYILT